jgi:hypothetical protein
MRTRRQRDNRDKSGHVTIIAREEADSQTLGRDQDGAAMTEFSSRQLQKCAEREAAMRRNVFTKCGMTDERRFEIAKMDAIAAHLKKLADDEAKAMQLVLEGRAALQ